MDSANFGSANGAQHIALVVANLHDPGRAIFAGAAVLARQKHHRLGLDPAHGASNSLGKIS